MDDKSRTDRYLPTLGASIRHHVTTVIVAIAAALALAAIAVVNLPSTYTASTVVLLGPSPGNPLTAEAASGSGVQTTVAMSTEAELVRTPAVHDVVATDLGRPAPSDDEQLEVTIPTNTQMLEIKFTSGTAKAAQEGAQAFADGYLAFRGEKASTTQESRIQSLQEQITTTEAELRRATAEASEGGAGSFASQEVQLLTDRLAQLNNSLSATQAVSVAPGVVITPAELPVDSNELPALVYLLAAAVIGLLAGIGVAVLREWRRDLVRDTDTAAEVGVPVFSTIRTGDSTVLASPDASGVAYEAYRRLRTAVIANGPTPHVLAVAAIDGESSLGVASNLAVVLADAGYSALLVEADPQDAESGDVVGIGKRPGLAELARGQGTAAELLIESHGISVLKFGIDPTKSHDLTANPMFRSVISELRTGFDYVVLAAAAAGSADGDAVLLSADSVLLVLTPNRTTRARLMAAMERFERLDIRTLGAVKVVREKHRVRSTS